MKIGSSSGPSRPNAPTRAGAPARSGALTQGYQNAPSFRIEDRVEITSLPLDELTPRVRETIGLLIAEVETLRHDLQRAERRVRELEDLADLDSLLPIPNRRAFVRELNRMISFAERYGTPSTIVFVDMNDLKPLNDSYGHEAGDKALKHVARILSDNLRGTDMIARLGGDEFGLLLAQTDEKTGPEKAKALIEILEKTPLELEGSTLPLSLAYGTYTVRGGDEASKALEAADKAMYAQKRLQKDGKEPR